MPGSFSFDPRGQSIPLGRPAGIFQVFRFDPAAPAGQRYTLLPNIAPESVHLREGPEPGSANCRYRFGDPFASASDPQRFEDAYPLDAAGPRVIKHDDRVCIRRLRSNSTYQLVSDGFAQIPQASIDEHMELVSFQVLGTPCREWDTPIGGAVYRDAGNLADGKDVETGRPTRFNPDGKPNAVDVGFEADPTGDGKFQYPTFLDEFVCKSRNIGRKWTLGMAVRYLLSVGNPDAKYVDYRAFSAAGSTTLLDDTLSALKPTNDGSPIDYSDPSTYTLEPIFVHDYDATGKAWPEAVWDIISPHGFGMRFRMQEDADGEPDWTIMFYRKDTISSIKSLLLQKSPAALDPAKSNIGSVRLQRDVSRLSNQWIVNTHPVIYECAVMLEGAFTPDANDAKADSSGMTDHRGKFVVGAKSGGLDVFDPIKYRQYVFDEVGDGHWDNESQTFLTGQSTSLDAILGKPDNDAAGNPTAPKYAGRRRPGLDTLVTKDADGKPRKAELWLTTDYTGPTPGVYDPKLGAQAHFQRVKDGWRLLHDRLGIELTDKDIEQHFNLGEDRTAGAPFPSGKVRVITCQADGTDVNPRFAFMLVCTIESDQDIFAVAGRRNSSPTKFSVIRRADARDRYRKEVVSGTSRLSTTPGQDAVGRDDTAAARSYCEAKRRVHELAVFGGSVTIPRFTAGYDLADRIRDIKGRDVSLQSSGGREQAEGAEYPVVVGVDWMVGDNQQSTTLHLSDRRVELYGAGRDVF